MTGIERLRKLIEDYRTGHECDGFECTELSCGKCMAKNVLEPIADQIERERNVSDREEHDAIAWVRDHGGLDAVKRRWECLSYYADPVPRVCMERRLARRQRQIDECHEALRRRSQRIAVLASEINRAHNENRMEFMRRAGNYTAFADEVCKRLAPQLRYVEGCTKDVMDAALDALARRLMPEGMEWPTVDGKPVVIGERMRSCGIDDCKVVGIDPANSRLTLASDNIEEGKATYFTDSAEYCHRPTPKVLDADGAEVHKGDEVWSTTGEFDGKRTVSSVYIDPDELPYATFEERQKPYSCLCCYLTHRAPVLAADGEPLEVGQTVYDVDAEADTPLTVVEVSSDLVRCEYTWKDGKTYRPCYPPDQLTHQRPDTWQRIEEDSTLSPEVYCHRNGIDISQKDGTEIFLADTVEPMARDLVRRCRALAERERVE